MRPAAHAPPPSARCHLCVAPRQALAPDARVVSDGLGCWNGVDEAGFAHRTILTGSGKAAAQGSAFKWVNTSLGNIKAAIVVTYRQLSPKHAGRDPGPGPAQPDPGLASFAWRFNRRFQFDSLVPRFIHAATRTDPLPYRALVDG